MNKEKFICPISRYYFREPVKASDNIFYEEYFINKWLNSNDISPFTGVKLESIELENCPQFNLEMDKFFEQNLDLEKERFIVPVDFQIKKIIKMEEFDKLLSFTNFESLEQEDYNRFAKCMDENIINHFMFNINEKEKHLIKFDTKTVLKERNFTLIKHLVKTNPNMLHIACELSDEHMVKYLIGLGLDIESLDDKHRTPIFYASHRYPILKMLIELGANLECLDIDGERLVHRASLHPNPEAFEFLVKQKINLEAMNEIGQRAIHIICSSFTNFDQLKILINAGVDMEAQDNENCKPIHYACRQSNMKLVRLLIEKKIDLNAINDKYRRPIHIVCERGDYLYAKLLCKEGVKVNVADRTGYYPIHFAIKKQRLEIVKLLIKYGANTNIDILNDKFDRPIFIYENSLIPRYSAEIVKYLVRSGTNIENIWSIVLYECVISNGDLLDFLIKNGTNLERTDYLGYRPIHFACKYGNIYAVQKLVEQKVDINCLTGDKSRPLKFAMVYNHIDIVGFLLDNGVDRNFLIELPHKVKQTPMMFACQFCTFEMVKLMIDKGFTVEPYLPLWICKNKIGTDIKILNLLLETGIDIEHETNCRKRRLIHAACYTNNIGVFKFLIEKGVNLECESTQRKRPIHYACKAGNQEMIETLIDKGVGLESATEQGLRPIHFAMKYCKFRTIVYLVKEKKVSLERISEEEGLIKYLFENKRLTNDQKISIIKFCAKLDPKYL